LKNASPQVPPSSSSVSAGVSKDALSKADLKDKDKVKDAVLEGVAMDSSVSSSSVMNTSSIMDTSVTMDTSFVSSVGGRSSDQGFYSELRESDSDSDDSEGVGDTGFSTPPEEPSPRSSWATPAALVSAVTNRLEVSTCTFIIISFIYTY
jgi:hypothetical protein